MKHEGMFSGNKRRPPRSPLVRATMQEPGAEGAGFGRSQGWSEKKKMNRGCTTPPPFCNALISTLSKYFHLLIKTIFVRSVGRELLLITVRKGVLGDRYLPKAAQRVSAIGSLGSQRCFQAPGETPGASCRPSRPFPAASIIQAIVGSTAYPHKRGLSRIF